MSQQPLFNIGLFLVVAGMLMVALTVILLAFSGPRGGKVSGGGVVIIGPFPIIFGSNSKVVKILAIVAAVLMVVYIVISML